MEHSSAALLSDSVVDNSTGRIELSPLAHPTVPHTAACGKVHGSPVTATLSPTEAPSRRTSQRTNSLLGVQILSTGSYVPDVVVTNQQMQAQCGVDPDWIVQRTGIHERRYCRPEQATSDLCVEAARRAIRNGRVDPSEIDMLVVGTFTPDFTCPSTAAIVQDKLGLDCGAFDVQAACAGFMYALVTAAQYVATGNSQMALVIGGDCNSRIVNPKDNRVAPLYGDGAGAVILTAGDSHQGLLCYQLGADGGGGPLLDRRSGGTRHPTTKEDLDDGLQFLQMDGRNVFKWAVQTVSNTIELMLNRTGIDIDDVSLYLMHQANVRIIDNVAEQLAIPQDRLFKNLQKYGNTSAGSIPIALDEAVQAGRVHRGDTLLMTGFGGGLTWGTSLFRW
ncbi:MAG: fabH 4 [Planctomycetaceae bacterium]|nr:fabH 4 [Planctomycetaceae bacterium]